MRSDAGTPPSHSNGETVASGTFEAFYRASERRLTVALSARYGPTVGRDAAIDALAWAWENWSRVSTMSNPAGYLYRVGQTSARRSGGRTRPIDTAAGDVAADDPASADEDLVSALGSLSPRQREVVVLTHGYGYTHREVGELLGISRSAVQNHTERGLARLRAQLEQQQ